MTAQQDALEAKLPIIQTIPKQELKTPDMPVETYVMEALFLRKWCETDRSALVARALDWALVEDIPIRVLALEEAESAWCNVRFGREEAMKVWMTESPAGYLLRDELLHEFRYAFRNHPELQTRVSAVGEGAGDADMIQDLNDLAVIGRENQAPLEAVNFNNALLDQASEKCHFLSGLRAEASVDKHDFRENKLVRDQAYTHLKEAVDEIRRCGQFVFWKNEDRLRGYASEYKRRARRSASNSEKEQSNATPNESQDQNTTAKSA